MIIPPRMTSVFSATPARSATRWVARAWSSAGVAGQGMARHVEAQRLLLLGQLLGVGQLGDVGQAQQARPCAVAVAVAVGRRHGVAASKTSKRPSWPRLRSSCLACPAWSGPRQDRQELRSLRRPGSRTRRPGSASRRSRRRPPWSAPARRSRRGSVNGPPSARALTIASTALNPTPLIAPSPKWIFPSPATWKVELPLVDVRRQHLDPHPPAVVDMFDEELVALGAVHLRGEHGGHELGRIVGLQVGRLIGDQGIGGVMRLVEAVAAEELDQVEDLGGLRPAPGPRSTAPSMNWSRPWAMTSAFFFEIALIVAYACESSMPPRRFRIRMTCSW